jgi:hypothetical protein
MRTGRSMLACTAFVCAASAACAATTAPRLGAEVRAGFAASSSPVMMSQPAGGVATGAALTWRVTRTSKLVAEYLDDGFGRMGYSGDFMDTRSHYGDCSVRGGTLAWRQDLATTPPPILYVLAGAGYYRLRIRNQFRDEGGWWGDTSPGFVLAAGFHGRAAITPVLDFRLHVVPAHSTSSFIGFTNRGTNTFQLGTISLGLAWR